jgi:hypothetical protein
VLVTDTAGNSGVDDADLVVSNIAPTVSIDQPGAIDATEHATLAARVADPGDDDVTVQVDWADGGAPETVPVLTRSTGDDDILATHRYEPGTGPHTAFVISRDDDGGASLAETEFVALPPNDARASPTRTQRRRRSGRSPFRSPPATRTTIRCACPSPPHRHTVRSTSTQPSPSRSSSTSPPRGSPEPTASR